MLVKGSMTVDKSPLDLSDFLLLVVNRVSSSATECYLFLVIIEPSLQALAFVASISFPLMLHMPFEHFRHDVLDFRS